MQRFRWRHTPLLLLMLALIPALSRPVSALDLRNTAWAEAAAPYDDLDPALLYAIALMESGRPRAGGLAPWPWTLWLPGQGGVFLETREQALVALRAHLGTPVDIGLMQVNLRWHGHRVASPEDLLEPQRNLEIAAAIFVSMSCLFLSAPVDTPVDVPRAAFGSITVRFGETGGVHVCRSSTAIPRPCASLATKLRKNSPSFSPSNAADGSLCHWSSQGTCSSMPASRGISRSLVQPSSALRR
mgnify:CR=1 FL=1